MIPDDTDTEVRAYFADIAASPSSPSDFVARQQWGGAETILMAVKALNRAVYVLSEWPDNSFNSTVFQPANVTMGGQQRRLAVELQLTPEQWVQRVRTERQQALTAGADFLTILGLGNSHYSSMIFRTAEQAVRAAKQATSLQRAVQYDRPRQADQQQQETQNYNPPGTATEPVVARNLAAQFEEYLEPETDFDNQDDDVSDDDQPGVTWDWDAGERPFDDDNASVHPEDLIEALGHPAVSHEEKQQLAQILAAHTDRRK